MTPRLEAFNKDGKPRVVPSLYLWRIGIRSLEVGKMGKEDCFYIGHRSSCSLREVAEDARAHYSEDWWKTYLMTSVEVIGPLRRIDGVSLFEDD